MWVLISGSRILAYQLPGRLPRKASVAFSVSKRAPNPSAWTTRRANLLVSGMDVPAVKAWLLDKGQVPAERVFVLSTHEGDDGKQPKAKVSRVDFSLR